MCGDQRRLGDIFRFGEMKKIRAVSGRRLTVIPLAAATYFMVSGGPYGLEELVQSSGYRLAIVILLLTPLIWELAHRVHGG